MHEGTGQSTQEAFASIMGISFRHSITPNPPNKSKAGTEKDQTVSKQLNCIQNIAYKRKKKKKDL